jgi:hypothetical protein
MGGGVEGTRHDLRSQTGVGGEHLVGADHRKAVAERDEDGGVDPRQFTGEHQMVGYLDPTLPGVVVEPVDPPEVAGVGIVRADPGGDVGRDRWGRRVGRTSAG